MFPGSRTTPTIDGDRIYTSGPLGDLYCISATSRKPVWHKNIWKEFGGGELPRWAVVQHPLIYGNLLIVAPQTPQAGVVAYAKVTGALKWKSAALSGLPGYVSPSIAKIGGVDQLVMITASVGRGRVARDGSVTGLDPASGTILWTYKGWQNPIPVPQPVDAGNGRLLITGGYNAGTVMIQVAKQANGSFGVTEVFRNAEVGAHTQPPILYKDHFYSHKTVNERNDGLVAMGMDGQVKWKTDTAPPFTRGGMILAEDLLIATDGDTKLYLVEPDPAAFKPLASAEVLESGDNWAPLALVDGKLLVRGQKQLKCLQVAQ
jgi:outer membrane protein assembly factor BamB